jgi:predicted cupin superfamily sugar epimerase
LEPDDTTNLIEGGPVDYFIFHPDGRAEEITLGFNVAQVKGQSSPWAAVGRHSGCTKVPVTP